MSAAENRPLICQKYTKLYYYVKIISRDRFAERDNEATTAMKERIDSGLGKAQQMKAAIQTPRFKHQSAASPEEHPASGKPERSGRSRVRILPGETSTKSRAVASVETAETEGKRAKSKVRQAAKKLLSRRADIDVSQIRASLNMTQRAFADYFDLSLDAVKQWESGRRSPRGPSRAFLRVLSREPDAVKRAFDLK